MQFWRKAPACTQRMAVHIIATKAIQNVSCTVLKAFKEVHTSNHDSRITSNHPKGRPYNHWICYVICCTHLHPLPLSQYSQILKHVTRESDLACQSDHNTTDREAEEHDRNSFSRSESQ